MKTNEDANTAPHEALDGLLNKRQIAERVGVSMRTVEFWMAKRLIPYVKIRKTVRFCWPDVEDAIKRNFGVGYAPFGRGMCVENRSHHATSAMGSSRGGEGRQKVGWESASG